MQDICGSQWNNQLELKIFFQTNGENKKYLFKNYSKNNFIPYHLQILHVEAENTLREQPITIPVNSAALQIVPCYCIKTVVSKSQIYKLPPATQTYKVQ